MKGPLTTIPMYNIASIDLGSHTARLLIARVGDDYGVFEPLMRKRSYIYLAGDFDPVLKQISTQASSRAVTVLKEFSRIIEDWQVKRVVAVATGVVRKAENRNGFLKEIFEETGLRVSAISGEKEARLTSKGALGALGVKNPPFFVFDLGGGTTEFLLTLFPVLRLSPAWKKCAACPSSGELNVLGWIRAVPGSLWPVLRWSRGC